MRSIQGGQNRPCALALIDHTTRKRWGGYDGNTGKLNCVQQPYNKV